MRIKTLLGAVLPLLLIVGSAGGAHSAFADAACVDDDDSALAIPAEFESISGRGKYALPSEPADTLVVFAHGYGHRSESWVTHLERTAAHGAVGIALDYRGTYIDDAGYVRGWFVQEGAADMVAAANAILNACHEITNVVIYGVSMGGNSSGLAVAAKAKKPNGAPLFDYWVAGEPAANVTETYHEAVVVAQTGSQFVVNARDDIEQEFGGTFAEKPEAYLAGTVVARVADIAASGVKGIAIVHGFDDGLVPYNQARELWAGLRAAGVPTDFYNAARRETDGTACGTDNTTLTENLGAPLSEGATGDCYTEPLAGHSTESSNTSLVVQTGLDLVFDLIDGQSAPAGHEFVVDGEAGVVQLV